jgi:hypothetical protein
VNQVDTRSVPGPQSGVKGSQLQENILNQDRGNATVLQQRKVLLKTNYTRESGVNQV